MSEEDTHAVSIDTALGSAFRDNATKIYCFIYAKVGNREVAEDLTSQVFVKATRWLAEDRSADSIRSWLYTTARSTIVDYWRELSHYPSVPLEESIAFLFCGTDGSEEVWRTRERAMQILDTLPERDREVLRLRFLRGYTAAEIGLALGLTAGHVRILQLRALRRAGAALAPPDDRLTLHADSGSHEKSGAQPAPVMGSGEEAIGERSEQQGGSGDER